MGAGSHHGGQEELILPSHTPLRAGASYQLVFTLPLCTLYFTSCPHSVPQLRDHGLEDLVGGVATIMSDSRIRNPDTKERLLQVWISVVQCGLLGLS